MARFKCHACTQEYTANDPIPQTPTCTRCSSTFVEVLDDNPPDTHHQPFQILSTSGFNHRLPPLSISDLVQMIVRPRLVRNRAGMFPSLGDYAWTEEEFQATLARLMDVDRPIQGLSQDQIDDLPRIIIEEIDGGDADRESECSICRDGYEIGQETIKLECEHQFHADCLVPWLLKVSSCPICRRSFLDEEEGGREASS